MEIATFSCDVTPPVGYPLLAGLAPPASRIDGRLEAIGVVIFGLSRPIVICAIDWCFIGNGTHELWRSELAEAAGTDPDYVLLHSVHQHNAPFVCADATLLAGRYADLPSLAGLGFVELCMRATSHSLGLALADRRPLTHIGYTEAEVPAVASTRRIIDDAGHLIDWRPGGSLNQRHKIAAEGLIDPRLRTIHFYSGDNRVAVLSSFATHPISYYRNGSVSPDFVGIARSAQHSSDPTCLHMYLTGCAGDVAPGKYNDGTESSRQGLADRLLLAMRVADAPEHIRAIASASFGLASLMPSVHGLPSIQEFLTALGNRRLSVPDRVFAAFGAAWRRRLAASNSLSVACLAINDVALVSLPGECFVKYQLDIAALARPLHVVCAAYGDGGPWYVPTREAFTQGGYEVIHSLCDPAIETLLTDAASRALGADRLT